MTPTRFIAEFGSNHHGKFGNIKQAIDLCAVYKLALKLQLFPKDSIYAKNNVYLPRGLFEKSLTYAKENDVDLSASVFTREDLAYLCKLPVHWVKIPYCQRHQSKWMTKIICAQKEPIVSTDILHESKLLCDVTKLLCIPQYPVMFKIDFNLCFPRFQGFSDHTLGLDQTERAIFYGAKIIEKHVKLGLKHETCPDAQFAVNLKDLGEFAKRASRPNDQESLS